MPIVIGDELHGRIVAHHAGTSFDVERDHVISNCDQQGRLLGGVIYTNFTGASFSCHAAGLEPNWVSRDFLWIMFDYPFVQCGVRKVFLQIKENNTKSLEFAAHLGFKEEVRVPDVFPEGAAVVMSMKRDQCRWLKIKPRGYRRGDGVADGW